jgi:glycosyltransferase involved in cell wall biosynthesis
MVTGAYYPDLSGGGLQARAVVRALQGAASFTVLTTTTDRSRPARSMEDAVPIWRVYVDVRSRASRMAAACRLVTMFLRVAPGIDIVNLHGFSRKAIPIAALSRLFGKAFVITLQTGIHDEPLAVRTMGFLAYWAYSSADLYLSVSPGLSRAYLDAGLPASRLRQVCNAVDVERFRPASVDERAALRADLGLPPALALVLFVGFFSRDKRPDVLYDAWSKSTAAAPLSGVVFVGATRSTYQEVDPRLADTIRERARLDGLADRVFFVESSHAIDKYFRAADMFVLPSIREGLSLALLEAMACGLPCVASRLAGSTDALIDHGASGLLVPPDDRDGLAGAIQLVLGNGDLARRLGEAARRTVMDRYSIQGTAAAWLTAYREVA